MIESSFPQLQYLDIYSAWLIPIVAQKLYLIALLKCSSVRRMYRMEFMKCQNSHVLLLTHLIRIAIWIMNPIKNSYLTDEMVFKVKYIRFKTILALRPWEWRTYIIFWYSECQLT